MTFSFLPRCARRSRKRRANMARSQNGSATAGPHILTVPHLAGIVASVRFWQRRARYRTYLPPRTKSGRLLPGSSGSRRAGRCTLRRRHNCLRFLLRRTHDTVLDWSRIQFEATKRPGSCVRPLPFLRSWPSVTEILGIVHNIRCLSTSMIVETGMECQGSLSIPCVTGDPPSNSKGR